MITLSLANADDFVTSAVLDNENYRLHLSWNNTGFWTMDIRDSENNRLHLSWNNTGFWTMDIRDDKNIDIVRGIKLVPNFPLLNQYRRLSNKLPRGEFLVAVVNQSVEKNQTISREGFSSGEFTLIYVPQEEFDSLTWVWN